MTNKLHILTPLLFILIYGSGFVGAKMGLPHAEPFTFLALRFWLAGGILLIAARLFNSSWPKQLGWLFVSGLLLQATFSAGVFYALYFGMKPAVSALIIALQPLIVALLAGPYLGESVPPKHWWALAVGLLGVSLVVADGLGSDGINTLSLSCSILALVGLSFGQLIQKRHCSHMDLITGGAIQTLVSAMAMTSLALLFESRSVSWQPEFWLALFWMGVGVSIGALSLFYLMLRQHTANRVATLFYGIPVSAALIAWPLFGQIPTTTDWLGFILVFCGVTIACRQSKTVHSKERKCTVNN